MLKILETVIRIMLEIRRKKIRSSKVNNLETPLLNYSKLYKSTENKTNISPGKKGDTFVIPNYQRKFVAFRFRELAGKEQSRSFLLFLFHFLMKNEF